MFLNSSTPVIRCILAFASKGCKRPILWKHRPWINQQHIFRIVSWPFFKELSYYKAIQEKIYLKALFPVPLYFTSCNYTVNQGFYLPSPDNLNTFKFHEHVPIISLYAFIRLVTFFLDSALSAKESVLPSHVYPQKIKANTHFTITIVKIIDEQT